ncbi:TIGR02594 family protein [Bradyrhizobium sp. CAR08]
MSIEALVASKPLRMGASGDVVRQVQLALKAAGYSLTGTGWFGPATDTAVETFQARAGLIKDGEVGPKTGRALDLVVAGKAPPVQALPQEIARPLWLEAGIKLIGTKEGAGAKDNANIIQWARDEGGDIAKEYTHDSIPWCALFANHCLTKVGLKGTGTLWALDFAGNWSAVKVAGPAVGAFAPMLRNGGGHIIQIVGKDQHGNLMGLGGNQSDAVNIEPFAVSRLNKGFWWPKSVATPPASQIGISHLPIVQSNGKVSINEA